nr:protein-L-isoaspartate(D-aspartate) O-methyltransferase [Rubripirellula obstinata]
MAGVLFLGDAGATDPYRQARDQLVNDRIATAGVTDVRVLDAIRETPRHEFVPRSQRSRAYYDMALPIGDAQTISSPFIVASMTEALDPKPTDKVLEIGTGSGYQAAVLSPLVEHVYTIEIVHDLGTRAKETLEHLGYENVSVRIGDGFLGWPSAAPFDKIIVTCSPESVPQPLVDQLVEGGQMIIPVGERYQQTLYRMIKQDGKLKRQPLRPTLFVPMTGEAESTRELKPDPSNPKVVNADFETFGKAPSQKAPSQNASSRNTPSGSDSKQDSGGGSSGQVDRLSQDDFVPGWYYGRQVRHLKQSGDSFVRFSNQTPGLSSHLLQGIAIDSDDVSMIRLVGRVRTEGVQKGPTPDAMPMVAISFYDSLRRDLGMFSLGPFRGTRSWRESSRLIRVPPKTREAIVRIGLFGATGIADFEKVSIDKID